MNPPGVSGCSLPQLTWARGASPLMGVPEEPLHLVVCPVEAFLDGPRGETEGLGSRRRRQGWGCPEGPGSGHRGSNRAQWLRSCPWLPSSRRPRWVWGGLEGPRVGGPGALPVGALQRRENQHSVGYFAFQSDFHLLTWPHWTLSAVLWDVQVIIIIPRVWEWWRCWWRASWLG